MRIPFRPTAFEDQGPGDGVNALPPPSLAPPLHLKGGNWVFSSGLPTPGGLPRSLHIQKAAVGSEYSCSGLLSSSISLGNGEFFLIIGRFISDY